MQPFSPPPLKIQVRQLDGVEDRPFNHQLTPEDIRKDSFYQKLAIRNAFLEQRHKHNVRMVVLAALAVFCLNALYLTPWVQSLKQEGLDTTFSWALGTHGPSPSSIPVGVAMAGTPVAPTAAPLQPVASAVAAPAAQRPAMAASTPAAQAGPLPGASAPAAGPSQAVAALAPVPAPALAPVATPAQQPAPTTDAANQLAAAIRALIDQQNTKQPGQPSSVSPQVATKPITLIPSITAAKPTPAPAQPAVARAALPVQESAPVKTASPLSIMDFFGTNTAVLLSPDGGQSLRTYRVGDALPSGEVVKAIDSVNGSVTTNQRIIKKQEPK